MNNDHKQLELPKKQPGVFSLLTKGIQAFGGNGNPFGNGNGYNAASNGPRLRGWNPSILGPKLLTLEAWQMLLRRSRDAVRNYALASSAQQKFVSNIIGTGVQPHFNHPDPAIKVAIQKAFDRWTKQADFAGQVSFYGLQAAVARQLFSSGESFCRFHVVDEDDGSYFQLQLLETEAVPIYQNLFTGSNVFGDRSKSIAHSDNTYVMEGIIFNRANDKRVGYQIYQTQPYDVLMMPQKVTFIDIPASEMIQILNPDRPGAIRGVPMLAPVLDLLYDIEGYASSERLRKRLAAMIAFFIESPALPDGILPPDNTGTPTNNPSVANSPIEPGSVQVLLPGEKMASQAIPESKGYGEFMYEELHKFAAGVGLTYEMVTGNMRGVNYSSARVALLEFQRQAEQFQAHVIIDQFCRPVISRWMQEAVLSGALELPDDYNTDPEQYESCAFIADGWAWVDPIKEIQAAQMAVRSGFTSRSIICRKNGFDPEAIEAEIAAERKREAAAGIITDTNANVVLLGRETQPATITQPTPNEEDEREDMEDENTEEET